MPNFIVLKICQRDIYLLVVTDDRQEAINTAAAKYEDDLNSGKKDNKYVVVEEIIAFPAEKKSD